MFLSMKSPHQSVASVALTLGWKLGTEVKRQQGKLSGIELGGTKQQTR